MKTRMTAFADDIAQQPALLRVLADFYAVGPGRELLANLPPVRRPLLTGMGASLNAARIAATYLHTMGIPAVAHESTALVFHSARLLESCDHLVFISQSGESAEVGPLTQTLGAEKPLIAITNTPDSRLGQRAATVLPVHAGAEQVPVASRTYVNSVATAWLLARAWGGRMDGSERDQLYALADAAQAIIENGAQSTAQWLDLLGLDAPDEAQTLLFMGHDPHAVTAQQTAMMVNEWVKRPAMGVSCGAFRHGPIEIAGPRLSAVIFAAPGPTQASAHALAAELDEYSTRVLLVEAGNPRPIASLPNAKNEVNEFLVPILDVIAAQLFVEALARHQEVNTEFRHIGKIITRL